MSIKENAQQPLPPVSCSVACQNNVRVIVDGSFLEIEAMRSGERLVAVIGDRERMMIIERLQASMVIKPPNDLSQATASGAKARKANEPSN